MGFSTSLPGIDEARLDAIANLLSDATNIANLNTMLTRDALWSQTVTSAMVSIGDPQILPAVADAPLIISVVGGGRYDELDMEIEYRYIDQTAQSGFRHEIYTNIYVYIHPDAVPSDSTSWSTIRTQAAKRERVRARVCDWLRKGVLNAPGNIALTLASREWTVSPNYDVLDRCHVQSVYKGYFEKGLGGSKPVYGAHLVHAGRIQ